MKVVDPHVHLWDTQQVHYPWLDNPRVAYSGDNRRLPKRYDVTSLLKDAAGIQVQKSVGVEANPTDPLAEAEWLQSLADDPANHGHPHGIVASVNLSQTDAPERLERLATCRNVRGVRQILSVHTDPQYDYVGRRYMAEPIWLENLKLLARYSWSFDLQLYPSQVPEALDVIDDNPDIMFIVNHAGMFVDRSAENGRREWREGLRTLAARPNTALKLSGFAMFDHSWSIGSLRPHVRESIDAFGPAHCMFASNFPIDGLHSSYETLWSAYAEIIADASETERAALLGGNAEHYYRLST